MDSNELALIWRDQLDFDARIRSRPITWEEKCAVTRDLSLGLVSEVHDMLQGVNWKPHRKEVLSNANPMRIKHEIGDMFKYLVSLCHVWEMSPDDLREMYWRVSRVCNHRWHEEHAPPLSRIALVDIDGVLCNYRVGLVTWLKSQSLITDEESYRGRVAGWLDAAALGVTEERWQRMKHVFRCSRAKSKLPTFEYSWRVLQELTDLGYQTVLLTSRPVHDYPNIRDETLSWLSVMRFTYDRLWFARDKHEAIARYGVEDKVFLAIDDDPIFCRQLSALPNAQIFHVAFNGFRWNTEIHGAVPRNVRSINHIQELYDHLQRQSAPGALPVHG